MGQRIAVIDYGMGNLHSVGKAVEHVMNPGDEVRITDDPDYVAAAERVVFPGQGAARDCMAAISRHHVKKAVLEAAASKPFLGICMGLQVLMEHSEENAGTDLLGLFKGRVRFFGLQHDAQGVALKIPQMGWNRVHQAVEHPLWAGVPQDSRFYFVHSYYVDPEDKSVVAGTTDYGVDFTCAIARDNLFAVQFHPEKSADHGLRLLANFVNWKP
jgi:glutamine amidotransferase